jgi:hypothetical protein
MVIVDNSLAFLGGIDLAVGRWDHDYHPLTDDAGLTWVGDDYYNPGQVRSGMGMGMVVVMKLMMTTRNRAHDLMALIIITIIIITTRSWRRCS